jgi:hypothetical protein
MRTFSILVLCLALSGCIAAVPAAIGAGAVGGLDVSAAHGCMGVTLANAMPWNADSPYRCDARK